MADVVYRVDDRSILLPYYRKYLVDPFLPFVPRTMHPNTITHVGHLLNLVGTVALVSMYPRRGWLFVFAMALLQVYMWCDNADGAHARRTGQCSPMGELLDHGLDQLNTVYIGFLTCMALGASPLWWVVIAIIIPVATAMTYWDQAATGTFHVGLLNQIESVTVLSIALTVSAICGSDVWANTKVFGISLLSGFQFWLAASILTSLFRNLQRVRAAAGVRATYSGVALLAFGISIFGAAAVGAISTVVAVTLATCMSVYFGIHALAARFQNKTIAIDKTLLVFTAVTCGFVATKIATGHTPSAAAGTIFAGAGCVVFGGLVVRTSAPFVYGGANERSSE